MSMTEFKAAVHKFCLFVATLFETCNCSFLRIYHYVGCVSARLFNTDESNGLRCMCGYQSLHRCEYSLIFGITDSTSWKYDPNKNFHRKMSSEQVSKMSATFVLTNWEKKHYNTSCNQWWLNLTITYHTKPCKLLLLLYFVLKMLMLISISIAWLCVYGVYKHYV